MEYWANIIIGIFFFLLAIYIHEATHYVFIRYYGLKTKFVFIKSFGIPMPAFRTENSSLHQAKIINLSPFPVTIIPLFFCYLFLCNFEHAKVNTEIAIICFFVFSIVTSLAMSRMDIKFLRNAIHTNG